MNLELKKGNRGGEKSPGLVPGMVRLAVQSVCWYSLKHTGASPVDESNEWHEWGRVVGVFHSVERNLP